MLRYLPADSRGQSRLDLAGVALLSVTVLLIVVPLTVGNSADWPAWAWASLAASLPAAAAFIAAERLVAGRGGTPLLDVGLFRVPVVRWSLVALTTASGTYYVLLFTVAQYLQGGLGRGPALSGLMLVPWVAAFGLAGQIVRRLPASRWLPAAGCLLLAAAYAAICGALFAGVRGDALLAPLFAVGGLGLGINFAALTGRLTGAVSARHAPDISGVSATLMSIGGSIGVAALGSLYLALARDRNPGRARHVATAAHAFGVTTAVLAGLGVLAGPGRLAGRTAGHRPGRRAGACSASPEPRSGVRSSSRAASSPRRTLPGHPGPECDTPSRGSYPSRAAGGSGDCSGEAWNAWIASAAKRRDAATRAAGEAARMPLLAMSMRIRSSRTKFGAQPPVALARLMP